MTDNIDELYRAKPLDFEIDDDYEEPSPNGHHPQRPPMPENPPEEPARPDRFRIIRASEALEEIPPPEYVVGELLEIPSVNVFVGEGGSKKTWALMHMAAHVATGEPWLEMDVKQGPVLFIDEESGEKRYKRRLKAILNAMTVDEEIPLYAVSMAHFNIMKSPEDVLALENLIIQTEAVLVVIDSLVDVMSGGDENAVKDVQPMMANLRALATRRDCVIVLIHHMNRSGAYRGTSSIRDLVDLMINVSSGRDSPNIDFETDKNRGGIFQKFSAVASWTESMSGKEQFTLYRSDKPSVIEMSQNRKLILRDMAENGGTMTARELNKSRSLRIAYYELRDDKLIERADGGGTTSPNATYRLTEEGRELLRGMGVEIAMPF